MVLSSRSVAAIMVAVVIALAACGDGDERMSPSRFCAEYQSTLSRNWASCARASSDSVAAASAFSTACASWDSAVAADRASFDEGRAESCLAAIDALECGGPAYYVLEGTVGFVTGEPRELPACERVVVGRVAAGDACTSPVECASGYCDMSSTCPGTCVPFRDAGESCGPPEDSASPPSLCAPGLFCPSAQATGDAPTCTPVSGVDGPCPCEGSFYCDRASGTCKVPKTSGACESGAECAVGHVCTSSGCRPASVLGDPCEPATAPVASFEGNCARGYTCDPASRRCIAALRAGESCRVQVDDTTYYLACLYGTQWSPDACTCRPRPRADGSACTQDGDCLSRCDRGVCTTDDLFSCSP